jgi:hypothetical protein
MIDFQKIDIITLFFERTKMLFLESMPSLTLSSMGLNSFLTTVPSSFLATIFTLTRSLQELIFIKFCENNVFFWIRILIDLALLDPDPFAMQLAK